MKDLKSWVEEIFDGELIDLGRNGDIRLQGILSPTYDQREIERFMSKYYASHEGASSQAEKINLIDYYQGLLAEAFQTAGLAPVGELELAILEIGCGFGSATFPLMRLMPQAKLIASEFSTAMLAELKAKLLQRDMLSRCVLMQLNAEEMQFKNESFDMIVGAAILHHLFEPEKVLAACARLLKPGGLAFFFEPFEHGLDLISEIYGSILSDARRFFLGPKTRRYLRDCISIWAKMKNRDKTDPFFNAVDDKWAFNRDHLEDMARRNGFSECLIYSLSKAINPLEELIRTHLEGNNIQRMPKWVWSKIHEYEKNVPSQDKTRILTEGCIILRK
jgi:ubiquinone/menaquinone biosynthesis C-methylase UbiE